MVQSFRGPYFSNQRVFQVSWKASGAAKEITHGTNGEKISMADKLVLMVLSDYFDERKQAAWPSQETLAEECICTDRGLRGILQRLQKFGLISIEHRGRLGNRYKLLFAIKGGKVLRNVVPQSEKSIEEQDDDIEEREASQPERAGSSEPLVVEPPEPQRNSATVQGLSKSTTTPNYKNFRTRFKHVTGIKAGSEKSLVALFMQLATDHGEDAVLDVIKPWAKETGKDNLKRAGRYAARNFLEQDCEDFITAPADGDGLKEKEASYPDGLKDNFDWVGYHKRFGKKE
jgi:hypothetical protein